MNSRFREERRQPPYYLLTGLLLGLALGFILTQVIMPVQYTNVPPETLNTADKDRYRLMIALAYEANQDIGRAESRLGLLRDDDIAGQLIQQSRRSETRSDAQVLLNLAQAIQRPHALSEESIAPSPSATDNSLVSGSPTAEPTVDATKINSTPTPTSTPEVTSQPTAQTIQISPTAEQNANQPFVLVENETICNTSYTESLIQVEVFDADGNPLPNIKVTVNWANGQDSFFTGFFPDISLGYADFTMTPPTEYSVKVGDIGELVSNLSAPECTDEDGNDYWGSVYLRFDAP